MSLFLGFLCLRQKARLVVETIDVARNSNVINILVMLVLKFALTTFPFWAGV